MGFQCRPLMLPLAAFLASKGEGLPSLSSSLLPFPLRARSSFGARRSARECLRRALLVLGWRFAEGMG